MIAARSHRDRGSIRSRSWSSSANLPGRSMELQVSGRSRSPDRVCPDREEGPPLDGAPPSDEDPIVPMRRDANHSMKISASSPCHVSPSRVSLKPNLSARVIMMIAWTQVHAIDALRLDPMAPMLPRVLQR